MQVLYTHCFAIICCFSLLIGLCVTEHCSIFAVAVFCKVYSVEHLFGFCHLFVLVTLTSWHKGNAGVSQ